ncbi:MAG: hypothetical protein PHU85_15665 [Phycisphaerae bacterium]|nr:hypothetical protein [Phycisphaerae bacterium]
MFRAAGGAAVTAAAEDANCRRITVQASSPGSSRLLVRLWIADTEYAAPDATDNTVAVVAGTTQIEAITAHAHYLLETSATGAAQIDLTIAGAATRYVMAEIDGRIYSSGQLDWAA